MEVDRQPALSCPILPTVPKLRTQGKTGALNDKSVERPRQPWASFGAFKDVNFCVERVQGSIAFAAGLGLGRMIQRL